MQMKCTLASIELEKDFRLLTDHSMAKGNLNKSKETTPTTTTASKYLGGPKSA